jgi:glutamyl/glutaminyl-tRNA synthetase
MKNGELRRREGLRRRLTWRRPTSHARPGKIQDLKGEAPNTAIVDNIYDVTITAPVSDAIEGITHSLCTLELRTTAHYTLGA